MRSNGELKVFFPSFWVGLFSAEIVAFNPLLSSLTNIDQRSPGTYTFLHLAIIRLLPENEPFECDSELYDVVLITIYLQRTTAI